MHWEKGGEKRVLRWLKYTNDGHVQYENKAEKQDILAGNGIIHAMIMTHK